jgi:hypothetical protein
MSLSVTVFSTYNPGLECAQLAFTVNYDSAEPSQWELLMSSISQQNPVRVFVAHAFELNDDYRRVFEYLESSRNFFYKNTSIPELPAGLDEEGLRQELRKQINLAEVVLVPAALYNIDREWADFQLNCAKGFDKPVVGIGLFGNAAKLPVQLEALADQTPGAP